MSSRCGSESPPYEAADVHSLPSSVAYPAYSGHSDFIFQCPPLAEAVRKRETTRFSGVALPLPSSQQAGTARSEGSTISKGALDKCFYTASAGSERAAPAGQPLHLLVNVSPTRKGLACKRGRIVAKAWKLFCFCHDSFPTEQRRQSTMSHDSRLFIRRVSLVATEIRSGRPPPPAAQLAVDRIRKNRVYPSPDRKVGPPRDWPWSTALHADQGRARRPRNSHEAMHLWPAREGK